MANRSNFGKPNQGGEKYKNHKLVKGDNVYRLGPAFKSLAAQGKWFCFMKQHFGYRTPGNEQNPNGFLKTFVCPQEKDNRTEMIKVPCAECDEIERVQGIVDARTVKMQEEGKTEEQIDAVLGVQKEWLKAHNLDKKYLVLAKNEKGEWGVLPLPYKAKQALDTLRKKLQASDGFDVLDPDEGAWVVFGREGEWNQTVYTCDVVYETVDAGGRKAKIAKQEALADADYDLIEATCPDLTTIGRVVTQEQIQRLVESGGDPEIVEEIFNESRTAREGSASPKPESKPVEAKPANKLVKALEETKESYDQAARKTVQAVREAVQAEKPAPNIENPQTTQTPDAAFNEAEDEEAKLLAQLAEARERKAKAAAQTKVEPKAETKTEVTGVTGSKPTVALDQLTDEQLLQVLRPKSKR